MINGIKFPAINQFNPISDWVQQNPLRQKFPGRFMAVCYISGPPIQKDRSLAAKLRICWPFQKLIQDLKNSDILFKFFDQEKKPWQIEGTHL